MCRHVFNFIKNSLKLIPKGHFGMLLGSLGVSWEAFGVTCGHFGGFWGHFGMILRDFKGQLVSLWEAFGNTLVTFLENNGFRVPSDALWDHFWTPWGHFGTPWGHFGTPWDHFWEPFVIFFVFFGTTCL